MNDESEDAEVFIVTQKADDDYYSAVVQAARAAVMPTGAGAPFNCLCAKCPASHWTLSDFPGRLEPEGDIPMPDGTNPWELRIFCRVTHEMLASFTPDIQSRALKPARGSRLVSHCDSHKKEIEQFLLKSK